MRLTTRTCGDFDYILRQLSSDPSIDFLELCHDNHVPHDLHRLAPILAQSNSLRVLHIMGDVISDAGIGAIVDALVDNTSLEELHIGNEYNEDSPALGVEGFTHLARLLNTHPNLKTLNLGAHFGPDDMDTMRIFTDAFKANTTIRALTLTANDFSLAPRLVEMLFSALKEHPLERLDLSQNAWLFCTVGMHQERPELERMQLEVKANFELLLDYLRGNQTLKSLYLDNNSIDIKYLKPFLQVITDATQLTQLSIAGNFRGLGALRLCGEMIAKNNTLVYLNLQSVGCEITEVLYIADALKKNSNLRLLVLEQTNRLVLNLERLVTGMNVSDGVYSTLFAAIADAIKNNYAIEQLFHVVGENDENRVNGYLERNRTLNRIRHAVDQNFIDNATLDEITEKLEAIHTLVGDELLEIKDHLGLAETVRLLYAAACIRSGEYLAALSALKKDFTYGPFQSLAKNLLTSVFMNIEHDYATTTVSELINHYCLLCIYAVDGSVEQNLAIAAMLPLFNYMKHNTDSKQRMAAHANITPVTLQQATAVRGADVELELIERLLTRLKRKDFQYDLLEDYTAKHCGPREFSLADVFVQAESKRRRVENVAEGQEQQSSGFSMCSIS